MYNVYEKDDPETKLHTDVVLKVTEDQYLKMRALYEVSEDKSCEVLALGQVELDPVSGEITLVDFFVPKQKGTPAECEMEPEALAKMIMDGTKVNFWLHTHPSMSAFWSGTDDNTAINELRGTAPFFLSIVLGKDMAHKIRIDFETPIPAVIDDIKIQIGESEVHNPFYDEMKGVFEDNVKKRRVVVQNFNKYYNHGYNYGKNASGGPGSNFPPSNQPLYGSPEWFEKYYPEAVPGAEGDRSVEEMAAADEIHILNSKKRKKRSKKRASTKTAKTVARGSRKSSKRGKK